MSIAEREGLKITDATLDALDLAAQGDLRLAINLFQSAARAHGSDLSREDFVEIAGLVPSEILQGYVKALMSGDFGVVTTKTTEIVRNGYSACQIVQQLHRELTGNVALPLSSLQRAALSVKLCSVERRLTDRGDDFLQLLDLGATFVEVLMKK